MLSEGEGRESAWGGPAPIHLGSEGGRGAQPLAVVTGASSGIGRAITERLLAHGWQVTGLARRADALTHPAYTPLCLDLGDVAQLEAALPALATPHAVVHAAGVLRTGALGALDAADGQRMWQLHVDVATRLANTLLPRMAEAGRGRWVMIGSRVSAGMPGRSQYAATKAAMVALTRSWAAELAPRGVTVNLVSPAATDTPMMVDPARASSTPRLPPIGRLIRPEEVAALVGFLLSDEAAALTGQDIALCGGASLPQ